MTKQNNVISTVIFNRRGEIFVMIWGERQRFLTPPKYSGLFEMTKSGEAYIVSYSGAKRLVNRILPYPPDDQTQSPDGDD